MTDRKIAMEQADEIIEYFGDKARERNLHIHRLLWTLDARPEMLFYTGQDAEIVLKLDYSMYEVGSLDFGRTRKGKLPNTVLVRDMIARAMLHLENCTFYFGGILSDSMKEVFAAKLEDKIKKIDVDDNSPNDTRPSHEQIIKKYRAEIDRLVGQGCRKAIDLGFKIYDGETK